ncbi:phospholipase-like protein [Tanacetum coccineum]
MVRFVRRGCAMHRADHLKKKKQNSDYYLTYNLYGFTWAFKDSNPNLELYATRVEKQTGWFIASIKFIKGLVDEDFNVSQDDGVGGRFFDSEGGATNPKSNKDKQPTLADVLDEVRTLRKEVALVKFDDARISKLERLLNDNFMFRNDISPNGNHNAVNQGLYGSANHPMVDGKNDSPNGNRNGVNKGLSCSANDPLSTCSGANILDGEVVSALIGIHKADGNNDSSNVNHNAVNKALSCSANDPMVLLDNSKVVGHVIGIHKVDGKNDSPNGNRNGVNKGLSCSANDPLSTCSSLDMDNGEVAVAGMEIHKADRQNDIPNANDNDVNQGIIGSANDPMILSCDGIGIDKADENNDYTYSQREPSTLDVLVQGFDSRKNHPGIDVIQHDTHVDCSIAKLNDHPTTDIGVKAIPVDEFADDFIDVLNDKESIPNYSLDDMTLQDEEEKLISTLALVNHQQVDELIDVHEDKTTMLQENVKDLSNKSQYVNVVKEDYKPCLGMVFANVKTKEKQLSRPHNCIRDKVTLPDGFSDFIKMQDPPEYQFSWGYQDVVVDREFWYPVAWRHVKKVYFWVNEPKKHWCLVELHISTRVVTFYDSLGWVCGNRRPWWRMMRGRLPHQLTLYLQEHEVLQSKGIAFETYEIKYMFPKVVRQVDNYGDCGVWVCIFLYILSCNLPLIVDDLLQTVLAYREQILQYFWRHKIQSEKTLVLDEGFCVRPDNLDPAVDELDINRLPRESIRFKRSTQAVVGQFIYWVGHERILADSGDSYKHYPLVSFDMINHRFQVIDIPDVVMRGLSVPLYLSIDDGSITSALAIMTMPSNHFLKLLGFNNHDLPIVEAATGHSMAHMVQVYMGNSQSFENVAIQGHASSFFVGFLSGGLMSYVDLVKVFRHSL